jgi:TPR repeat protein
MRPDIALARHWYQQAINLGSKDARDRLDMLPAQ